MSPRECCVYRGCASPCLEEAATPSVCASRHHLTIPHIGNLWLNTAILLVGSCAVNDGGYGAVKLSLLYITEIVEVSVKKSVIRINIRNTSDKYNRVKEFCERVITKLESTTSTLLVRSRIGGKLQFIVITVRGRRN